jgi:hypothetical protein
MFHPALSNGMLLQKVIYSFEDMTREEKEKHYTTLKNYIWKTIKELAERVAFKKLKKKKEMKKMKCQLLCNQKQRSSAS